MEKSNSDLFNMKVSLTDTSQIAIHFIETSQKLNDDIKVLIERI